MVIRIPSPGEVIGLGRSTVGWAFGAVTAAAGVPARVLGLIDGVEALVERVGSVVDRAEQLVERAASVAADAEATVREARSVAGSAAAVLGEAERVSNAAADVVSTARRAAEDATELLADAGRTSDSAAELLATYEPMAKRAAPLANRFVEELSEKEVEAAVRLVDELPVLTEHILSDVLPILRTLDRVGPEIHELLEVTHDVRRAIVGIPGFQFFRRRGEERVTEEEVTRPNSEHFGSPPPSPPEAEREIRSPH